MDSGKELGEVEAYVEGDMLMRKHIVEERGAGKGNKHVLSW